MNIRQQQKQLTRAHIRKVAKKLFVKNGYDAATIRQIAEAANVASGTIFVHFPSKQAILVDILFEDIEIVVGQVMTSLPKTNSLEQFLYIARSLFEYYAQHPDLSRELLRSTIVQGLEEDRFQAQIEQFVLAIEQLLLNQKDVKKNTFSMAEALVAAYFYVLMSYLRSRPLDIDKSINQLKNMSLVILS